MPNIADRDGKAVTLPSYRTNSAYGTKIVTAVALLLAGGLVADTITTVIRLHSALPYWDEWDNLNLLNALLKGQANWTELFSQNNEHRIFFPRVLMFSDYLYFGGLGRLNLATILTTQLFHAGMLLWLLRQVSYRVTESLALASVMMMMLFSLRQEENFSWGLQVAFVGVYALGTLSIVFFTRGLIHLQSGRPFRYEIAAAFIGVSVATYTMANGIFIAPVLTALAVIYRAPIRVVAAPIILATVLMGFYLYQYQPMSSHASISELVRNPIRLATYTSIMLGNFLYPSYQASRLLGVWGLLAALGSFIRIMATGDRDETRLACFAIILFTSLSAVLTEAGRFQFGVDQAFSSRYAVVGGVFWSATLIYWWSVCCTLKRVRSLRAAVGLTAVVLTSGAVFSQALMKDGMEDRAWQQRLATDGLLLGVKDEGSFGAIDDPTESLTDVSEFLKSRSISIYGSNDALLIGQSINMAGRVVDATDCQGSIDDVSLASELALPNAARISGRVWGRKGHRSTDSIYVANAGETIVGLATRGSPLKDPATWSGFVLSKPDAPVSAFARLTDGGLCKIATATVGHE